MLLGAAGAGLLLGLMQIPDRLDALLLVSNAIANLIDGLSHLSIGVLQLAGVLMVVALALLALRRPSVRPRRTGAGRRGWSSCRRAR